jgi:hypothetical protein
VNVWHLYTPLYYRYITLRPTPRVPSSLECPPDLKEAAGAKGAEGAAGAAGPELIDPF